MSSNERIQGIYGIRNKVNDWIYVGQSYVRQGIKAYKRTGVTERFDQHRRELKKNKHCNQHLQNAWNKYGEENFEFIILEQVDDVELLNEREQFWIDKVWDNCYNISPTAGSLRGAKQSKEHVRKRTEAITGRIVSEDTRRKISQANKGRKTSNDTRRKISNILLNLHMKRSEETKEQIKQTLIATGAYKESQQKAAETVRRRPPISVTSYKGVSHNRNGYIAMISPKPHRYTLGYFNDPKEAAMNYDYYAIHFFGRGNCYLNFPDYDYSNFIPKKDILNND